MPDGTYDRVSKQVVLSLDLSENSKNHFISSLTISVSERESGEWVVGPSVCYRLGY